MSTKLLLVDDSRVSLVRLKRMLADSEFEAAGEARSGAEAIAQYPELKPDIVLLDIVMPDMDGVEVLVRLRELDGSANVVMASSLGTKEKVIECTEKGARSFLMKPFEKDDLLQALRAVVKGGPA